MLKECYSAGVRDNAFGDYRHRPVHCDGAKVVDHRGGGVTPGGKIILKRQGARGAQGIAAHVERSADGGHLKAVGGAISYGVAAAASAGGSSDQFPLVDG